jgi:hypothetical protein
MRQWKWLFVNGFYCGEFLDSCPSSTRPWGYQHVAAVQHGSTWMNLFK